MQDPENSSAEAVLRRFDEQHNKYKFMEANLSQKKKRCAHCHWVHDYVRLHALQSGLLIKMFLALKSTSNYYCSDLLSSNLLYALATDYETRFLVPIQNVVELAEF